MKNRCMPPAAQPDWAYFLDMDGTLVDITGSPDAIQVDDPLLALVARLHAASGGALALVSGRALADLDRRFGAGRLPAAGQHGLERRDAMGGLHAAASADPTEREELLQRLTPLLSRHPALVLEDKGLSLALHYRQAPRLAAYAHRLARSLVASRAGRLHLQRGKRVVEIRPRGVDKGSAILDFMAEPPFRGRRPVFVGDDITDEHGFEAVNRLNGVSVKVGRGQTLARWRLPDIGSVRSWLGAAADFPPGAAVETAPVSTPDP